MPESEPQDLPGTPSERPASESRNRPSGAAARSTWAWPVAFVIVALAMVGAGLYVFESVRRQIGEFVTTWLAGSFGDGADYSVDIVFADEGPRMVHDPDGKPL